MLVDAQKLIFEAWAVFGAIFLGLGLLERRLLGPRIEEADELWSVLWTGWAILLSFLQVWHIFSPVDDRARWIVAGLAAAGWLAGGLMALRAIARSLPLGLLPWILLAPVAWWLSVLAMIGPRFGDTGMYLIPTIKWYESYASVPGLANLFVPLGHNLSYFLYAAFMDAGPLQGRIYHFVNSTIVIALLARGLVGCVRLLGRDTRHIASDVFYALAAVPLVDLAYTGIYLTSPMPDTGVFVAQVILSGEFVALLEAAEPSRARVLRFVFFCAAATTLKLQIAGMSIAAAVIGVLHWMWRTRPSFARAFGTLVAAALVALIPLGTWMTRNVITSGFPLYPASLFPLPVDWISKVDATAWIQKPMAMAPLWTVFSQAAWWKTRMISLGWAEDDAFRMYVMMAAGFATFLILRPMALFMRRRSPVTIFVLVPAIAGFFFTFLNTPMVRYQGATLWVFGIELAVLGVAAMSRDGGRLLRVLTVACVLYGVWLPIERRQAEWVVLKNFEGTSQPRIHTETLASGLVVNVPEGQVCWDAPLPCTPEPHPGLQLRDPSNLGAGFRIDESVTAPPAPS